jgi:hypothetical protein
MKQLRHVATAVVLLFVLMGPATTASASAATANRATCSKTTRRKHHGKCPASSTAATAPGTSTTGPYHSGPIQYTLPDGWTYVYTPALGRVLLDVTKDISTSPPGMAKLRVSKPYSTTLTAFPGTIAPDTPGRTPPGDPFERYVTAEWPLSSEFATNYFPNGVGYVENQLAFNSSGCVPEVKDYGAPTQSFVLSCRLATNPTPEQAGDTLSDDLPEAEVDALVQALASKGQPTLTVVTISAQFILTPDGKYAVV